MQRRSRRRHRPEPRCCEPRTERRNGTAPRAAGDARPRRAPPPPAPSRTRALRAREPAAGGDWLPGAPRGPPGRGRPPSAIHGAARLHAPRLIHKKKKTSFIKAAAAPGARRGGSGSGAAAPRTDGTACTGLRRARGCPALKDFGARIGEPEAESCCGLGGL